MAYDPELDDEPTGEDDDHPDEDDDEPEENPREKGDDDGIEYGDPRDALEEQWNEEI